MSTIRNTSRDMQDPFAAAAFLMQASADGEPGSQILAMEAQGQRELVASDRLPVRVISSGGDEPFLAAGFTFGEPDPDDPLFRPATLPAGWVRKPTDHAMWSVLVDEHGRERVMVFYKAAFYDRRAHMLWQGES